MLNLIILSAVLLLALWVCYRQGYVEGTTATCKTAKQAIEACGRECYDLGYSQGHEAGWAEGAKFSRPHIQEGNGDGDADDWQMPWSDSIERKI
jgi:hypothetical protein